MLRLLIVGLVACFAFGKAEAQTVMGRTVSAGTEAGLAGVFVTVTDTSGDRVAGFISRADGSFLLRVPEPGSYRLTGDMIGYRSVEEEVELTTGQTLNRILRMPHEPVRLGDIVVRSAERTGCRIPRDEGGALARLWSEVEKALRVAEWAQETEWLVAIGYTYERVLDLVDEEVLAETMGPTRLLERQAFTATNPSTIRADGFIRQAADGSTVYRGADAHLLLSSAFLETHCFRLIDEQGDQSRVGITFEPVPGREVPDIDGVLWLDRETGRLESLEYNYTRYTGVFPVPMSRFGGRTEFRHLPGGGVAVERWWIRMPSVRQWADGVALRDVRRCGMNACDDRPTLRALKQAGLMIEEAGGEVLGFSLADGTPLPLADRASIAGMVLDSTVTGQPVPLGGAEVVIEGTQHRAVTDASGKFRLDHLSEGTYRLSFHHPRLIELGIERPRAVLARTGRGAVVNATLATPSWATLATLRCEEHPDAPALAESAAATTVVHGVVRDAATGATIGGAEVRLKSANGAAAGMVRETDPAGRYVFCSAPVGAVRFTADYLGKGTHELPITTAPDRPTRADVDLVLSTAARLMGRVVRAGEEVGVPGAVLRIVESGQRAVTDESGRFSFDSVSPGVVTVETEHIAYKPSSGVVAVRGGQAVHIEMRLSEGVLDLDPLVVTTRAQPLLMDHRMGGFYMRQARGFGTFIDRELLEDRPAAHVTDLLREVPEMRVVWTGRGRIIRATRNPAYATGSAMQNPFCSPIIYLDGVRLSNRLGAPGPGSGRPDPSPLEETVRIIDGIPTSEIMGIEIYAGPASVPGEFAGLDTQCGVIAVWTRVSDSSPDVP